MLERAYVTKKLFTFLDDVSSLNCCKFPNDKSNIKKPNGRDCKKMSSIGGPIVSYNEAISYVRTVIYFAGIWAETRVQVSKLAIFKKICTFSL